jgi:hypothetical protein
MDSHQTNRPLWLIAQGFIQTFFSLFGAPEEIAAEHTLLRDRWKLIAKWLRGGEALMRHLLLIGAAALPKPNTRPLLWKRRVRKRRLVYFSADAPQDWRVSFRCFVDQPRTRAKPSPPRVRVETEAQRLKLDRRDRWHQARWPAPKFHSAWPLAERAEALLRVFNDPAPYARRLAARLYATPHRARPMLRYPAESAGIICVDDIAQTRTVGETLLPRFDPGWRGTA